MALVTYRLFHVACSSATFKLELTKYCDLNYNRICHFRPSGNAIAFFIINSLFCGFLSFDVNLCKNESCH